MQNFSILDWTDRLCRSWGVPVPEIRQIDIAIAEEHTALSHSIQEEEGCSSTEADIRAWIQMLEREHRLLDAMLGDSI